MTEAAATLPVEMRDLLDGTDLEDKVGETFLLLTVGPNGFPRVALLSVGELYAPSADEVRLALWRNSTTTQSLTTQGRATLGYFSAGNVMYVALEARRVRDADGLALFTARVASVRRDEVEFAEILSGVRYRLRDPASVLPRWRRAIDALRAL